MILPDMIYNHGLQLPDLADFPGAGEVRFPSDVDWLPFDGEFNQAMREYNIDKFQIAYTKLCMDIFSNVNLSPFLVKRWINFFFASRIFFSLF